MLLTNAFVDMVIPFLSHIFIGYGVFASKVFSIGQYLLTYKGSLLNVEEGEARMKTDQAGNFLFFFDHIGKELW